MAGDHAVIELDAVITQVLDGFMSTTGDHHEVARPRCTERLVDRLPSIDDRMDTPTVLLGDPRQHVIDDRRRILRARVVGGEHRDIASFGADPTHRRALVSIAIATTPVHANESPLPHDVPSRGEELFEPVGGVGVVDDHPEPEL